MDIAARCEHRGGHLRRQIGALGHCREHAAMLEVAADRRERVEERGARRVVERLQLRDLDEERGLFEVGADIAARRQDRREQRRGNGSALQRRGVHAVHLEVRLNRAGGVEIRLARAFIDQALAPPPPPPPPPPQPPPPPPPPPP